MVRISVITQHAYGISEAANNILKQMAEEDHVSMTTEIENAISGWYRFRHGYVHLATSDPYIINEEMERIHKSIDRSIREQQEGMKDAAGID